MLLIFRLLLFRANLNECQLITAMHKGLFSVACVICGKCKNVARAKAKNQCFDIFERWSQWAKTSENVWKKRLDFHVFIWRTLLMRWSKENWFGKNPLFDGYQSIISIYSKHLCNSLLVLWPVVCQQFSTFLQACLRWYRTSWLVLYSDTFLYPNQCDWLDVRGEQIKVKWYPHIMEIALRKHGRVSTPSAPQNIGCE